MESLREWFLDTVFGNGYIAIVIVVVALAIVGVARIFRPGRL
ncbi:MAG: hypothetical protein QM655_04795 [Nocardioidaceae bacterium]